MCNQSEAANNRTQWQKEKKINNHPKNTTQKTGRFSIKNVDFVSIRKQTWPPQTYFFSDWPISKNLLLWNCLVKWTKAWLKASMEGLLCSLLILSRSVYKLGRQRHLLFLVWRFLKISSPLMSLVQMHRNLVGSIYWRSSMQIANFVPIS